MVQTKKVPLRKCAGCQEMKDKRELLRVIRTPEGEVRIDATGRANGRGVYLCKSLACFEKARKRQSLGRALSVPVPEEILDRLEEELRQIEQ